ncbi:ABC transporter ATP-binding protein [Flexivirga endophytica]|uniref:ABC transporter ATP-binding protein n=1 Tax=Flexivirga endophytica TaxID=1849103 RepID=A0A916T3Z2_9MICO|nr:ABC transporter ATP-binding protein [Flexivirga endophytica]GGB27786.1 ABC transporter ATP-binding protein [Flexivirga endophytica]GHB61627.1 ABC transporter ATP-binding protein [Flexivirga endophytica]
MVELGKNGEHGGSRHAVHTSPLLDQQPVLSLRDLQVTFRGTSGPVPAVNGVTLEAHAGQVVAIVGESGSGKSATALASMGLLPDSATVTGSVLVEGTDLNAIPEKQRVPLRGSSIAMIFQDALAALNPYRTVGRQIIDAYRLHHDVDKRTARERAVEVLDRVGIRDATRRVDDYPHEFSGGMRQRAMIAMAVVNDPTILIADEPTTALDVTVQRQVLDLLTGLTDDLGMALVLITHDLGVVAEVADQIAVMYAGRIVESGSVLDIFDHPAHPYTQALLGATPNLETSGRLAAIPGVPASGTNLPSGCPFHPRCAFAAEVGEACRTKRPVLELRPGTPAHRAACHFTTDRELPDA